MKAEVVGVPGKAFVTIIGRDGAQANHEQEGPPFLGDNYTMSILAVGDTYDLPDENHPHGAAPIPSPPIITSRSRRTTTTIRSGPMPWVTKP